MGSCIVCHWRPATRKDGRCNGCRMFKRRYGRDRTPEEAAHTWELAVDRAFPRDEYWRG